MKRALVTLVGVLATTTACGQRSEQGEHTVRNGPPAAEFWSAELTGGPTIHVRPEKVPVVEGNNVFLIELDPAPSVAPPVSVDLVSPTMLTHGITRFTAHGQTRGRFRVEIEIPMAGAWSLYVNLDDNQTSAAFPFDAAAPDDGELTAHHPPVDRHSHSHSAGADSTTQPSTIRR